MKKGQSGVSLIALVITIIVVIILAAIAFGTSTRTITNANWSTFTNAVGEVRTALQERVTTVKGEEAAKGTTRTDAQVYNFVAKSGETANWLSRGYADQISATRIEPDVIKNTLGLKNLNTIKVNTPLASGREVSYFVTREGNVFVWPPYEYEGKWYVNENTTVSGDNYDGTADKFNALELKVGSVVVKINSGDSSVAAANNINAKITSINADTSLNTQAKKDAAIAEIPTVYYKDASNAGQPVGLETVTKYDEATVNGGV